MSSVVRVCAVAPCRLMTSASMAKAIMSDRLIRIEFLPIDMFALLPRGRLEVARIRRRLILARRHQVAVAADHVVLGADKDVVVAFRTGVLGPDHLLALEPVALCRRPGPRQRRVDGG